MKYTAETVAITMKRQISADGRLYDGLRGGRSELSTPKVKKQAGRQNNVDPIGSEKDEAERSNNEPDTLFKYLPFTPVV